MMHEIMHEKTKKRCFHNSHNDVGLKFLIEHEVHFVKLRSNLVSGLINEYYSSCSCSVLSNTIVETQNILFPSSEWKVVS